jgi:glutamine cyclotransferase
VGLVLVCGLLAGRAAADEAPETLRYRVVATYPHDRRAFTQGLIYRNGVLFESTGRRGQSTLRRVDLATGRPLKRVSLADRYFAEGLASLGGRLFQLTWTSGEAFVYRQSDLARVGRFRYEGEGWGLTDDGTHLVMSDGSATLSFREPETFEVTKRVVVRDRGRLVPLLNELEYVDGSLFANVWPTPWIARIAPETGVVTGWLDLSSLARDMQRHRGADVLNGIAHQPVTGHLLVTGKNWPRLFALELVP